jgi:rhodanese-related sulfurtransferase
MISLFRTNRHPYRDPEKLRALIDGPEPYHLVDVRSREEFEDGYIPTAVWIPCEQIVETPPTRDPDALIILYCYSGVRSETARKLLIQAGYRRVYNFGGIIHWPGELVTDGGVGNEDNAGV